MPVKSVILDRDGTLYNPMTGKVQDGVPEMIQRLQAAGLELFVASNEDRDSRIEKALGLNADRFLYQTQCGMKGQKGFIKEALKLSGHLQTELVYLGDSENDMREASGGGDGLRIALFNAEWSNKGYKYGLQMASPSDFADHLQTYYLKQHNWYFTVDGADALDREVFFRALLDPDTCKNKGITRLLKDRNPDFHKNQDDWKLAVHLICHLVASIYMDGIHLYREPNSQNGFKLPLWCLYPGRSGDISPILELFERFAARLLTTTYRRTLLERHVAAPSSHVHRMNTKTPQPIEEQFKSVSVNTTFTNRIKGNVVMVVDDFSTGSNAMEVSRNLLYACGAKKVIGITVGKYGSYYTSSAPHGKFVLPSQGGPVDMTDFSLATKSMPTVMDAQALAAF